MTPPSMCKVLLSSGLDTIKEISDKRESGPLFEMLGLGYSYYGSFMIGSKEDSYKLFLDDVKDEDPKHCAYIKQ